MAIAVEPALSPHLVVDDAAAAIDFYKRLGATFLDDWKEVRVEGDALRLLAEMQSK